MEKKIEKTFEEGITQLPLKDFNDLKISTQTVIVSTNWVIDIEKLFEQLPITPYTFIPTPRKNPRRFSSGVKIDHNLAKLPNGSIITLKYRGDVRGIDVKQTKKIYSHRVTKQDKKIVQKKPFRNSMMVVMKIADKKITFKIPSFGRIQICGCKNFDHAKKCVKYMWLHISTLLVQHPYLATTLKEYPCFMEKKVNSVEILEKRSPETTGLPHKPKILFFTVMINKDFNVGFILDREKLNTFINKNTEYKSLLETSVNTSAIVKIKSDPSTRPPLVEYEHTDGLWSKQYIPYQKYIDSLNHTKKKKEILDKYHSFLMFHSGSIILSSPFIEEMKTVYKDFIGFIIKNRACIEERLICDDVSGILSTLI